MPAPLLHPSSTHTTARTAVPHLKSSDHTSLPSSRPSRFRTALYVGFTALAATQVGSVAGTAPSKNMDAHRRLASNYSLSASTAEISSELEPVDDVVSGLSAAHRDASLLLGNTSSWELTLTQQQQLDTPTGKTETQKIQRTANATEARLEDTFASDFSDLNTQIQDSLSDIYNQSLQDEVTVTNYYDAALTELDTLCETEDCDLSSVITFRENLLTYKNDTISTLRYIQAQTAPNGALATSLSDTIDDTEATASETAVSSIQNASNISQSILALTLQNYATAVSDLSTGALRNASGELNDTLAYRPYDTSTFTGLTTSITSAQSSTQSSAVDMINSTLQTLIETTLEATQVAITEASKYKKAHSDNLAKDWIAKGPTYYALQGLGILTGLFALGQTVHRLGPGIINYAASRTSYFRPYATNTRARTTLDALRSTYDLSDFTTVHGRGSSLPGTEGREYYKSDLLYKGLIEVQKELSKNSGKLEYFLSRTDTTGSTDLQNREARRSTLRPSIQGSSGSLSNIALGAAVALSVVDALTTNGNQNYCTLSQSDVESLLSYGLERAATYQDTFEGSLSDTLGLVQDSVTTTDSFIASINANYEAISRGEVRASNIVSMQQSLLTMSLGAQQSSADSTFSDILSPFTSEVSSRTTSAQIYVSDAVNEAQELSETPATSWIYPVFQLLTDGGTPSSSNITAVSESDMKLLLSEENNAAESFETSTLASLDDTFDSVTATGSSELSETGDLPIEISDAFETAQASITGSFPTSSEYGITRALTLADTSLTDIPDSDTLRDSASDVTTTVYRTVDDNCDDIATQTSNIANSEEKIKFYQKKIESHKAAREDAWWNAAQLGIGLTAEELFGDILILQPLKDLRKRITETIQQINESALENATLCIQNHLVSIDSLRTNPLLSVIPESDFETGAWLSTTYDEMTGKERLESSLNSPEFLPMSSDGFFKFKDAINGEAIPFSNPYDAGIKTFLRLEKKSVTWTDTIIRAGYASKRAATSARSTLRDLGTQSARKVKECWTDASASTSTTNPNQDVQVELGNVYGSTTS